MMDAGSRPAESELASAAIALDAAGEQAAARPTIYVYEAPVRTCHWVNALSILVLMVSGYLIGTPPPMVAASGNFVIGYIRFAHFAAAQVLAVFFLVRILWALFGNHHSRQIFYIPVHRKQFWKDVLHEIRWYAFLEREPKIYVDHNPLAQTAIFTGFTLLVPFMIVTGFALFSEGAGIDSWQHELFGWVFALWPNSHDVHTWHRLGMWALTIFLMVHIYAAVREDIMSPQSIISSMISGVRQCRDNRRRGAAPICSKPRRVLLLGIGNILWADEGFGVRAVEEFHHRYAVPAEVTILDGGTQGLQLVNYLQESHRLIVFDAIDYGLEPGELKLVRDEEVPRFTGVRKMSLHHTGFQEVISACCLLGHCPKHLVLIGCQPLALDDWGGPLTPAVRNQIGPAVELARFILVEWGVQVTPRITPLRKSEWLLANGIDHLHYEMRART
ncbi:hypothetical protein GCM10007857_67830 [Bradyrhizobium iriomotense]|uniref:Cytochrome b561 bacterial/Ni-hydrogenase domain-containing protein n=1 Tax=Bradyrhizobium iriomotense TaxID=441950 RepID=A0ABQ6B6M2_9BRAD|nr:hypothetical protein GCM10007857_67830 [Bradyrhizobium iriomotense]